MDQGSERKERLAKALRDNLRRRKAQSRASQEPVTDEGKKPGTAD